MQRVGHKSAAWRGGKRVEERVVQVLGTLVRYGRVTAAGDRFAA